MYVVLVGAGTLGFSLARWLVSRGHEITVIDTNRSRCSLLDHSLGRVSIVGNATDTKVLDKAGANRADIFIATSSKDDTNLVSCQLAKHHFGILKTFSIVNNPDREELFSLSGIDVTINSTKLIIERINQEGLFSQGLVHLMPMSSEGGKNLVAIKVPLNSHFGNRLTKSLPLPNDTILTLIIDKEGIPSIPNETTLIQPGDYVIAVTSTEDEDTLRKIFYEENEGV